MRAANHGGFLITPIYVKARQLDTTSAPHTHTQTACSILYCAAVPSSTYTAAALPCVAAPALFAMHHSNRCRLRREPHVPHVDEGLPALVTGGLLEPISSFVSLTGPFLPFVIPASDD